jgi:hypothetical protein
MELKTLIHPREHAQQELFIKFANLCAQEHANVETMCGAAISLIITVVHRMNTKQGDAEARWDDIFGQGKELLKARFSRAA